MKKGHSPVVAIRHAALADSHAAAGLLHDFNTEFSFPTPGVENLARRIRLLLEGEDVTILLAGQPPCGLAVMRLRPSIWTDALDAYLEEFFVAKPNRGEGVGRALLEMTMTTARQAGARRMELGTSETDVAARRLYESCGFTDREGGPDGPMMLFYERDL